MFAHRKFAICVVWFAMERGFAFVKIEIDRAQKERKNTIFLRYKKNECSQKWVKARLYMIGYGIEKNYFEYAAF